jgi:ankyrin repeat protein
LIGVFQSFTRRTPQSRLTKQDELGYGLLHYAAMHNRPLVIATLMQMGIDINIRQQIEYLAIGPMPLHYAARCCSVDSLSCLMANFANMTAPDNDGWAPIHHACYFDNVPVLRMFLRKQRELVECLTRGESRKTPVMVAASAGSLEAVKCLISHGANLAFQNELGYNLIHVAAHK